ncbi:MAG: NADH-quinone oxidoreductase subunit J [Archaeoglobales archaeon]|nr:NADH-quinone oxidoreductase subunit J [Archaeoglobales archaeon]
MDLNLLIPLIGALALSSAIGALLTRENFYSALYMSLTMLFIAGIYAFYNLQPSVVLITLVFVGAVGVVTIAIAATYRAQNSRRISYFWAIIVALFSAILILQFPPLFGYGMLGNGIGFLNTYLMATLFLVALMILIMLSTIKILREVER